MHLGIDIFAPAEVPIFAPMDGEIVAIENRTNELDYGGMIILKHKTDDSDIFYSLYGHLNPNFCKRHIVGKKIKKGEQFCVLGDISVNGGCSHLHFQIALTTNGLKMNGQGLLQKI